MTSSDYVDPRVAATKTASRWIDPACMDALLKLDDHTNVLFLALDWLTIAGAVVLAVAVDRPWALGLAIVLIGSRQRALMNLLHQASHRQLFRGRRRNDWAGRICTAFPLGMSLDTYAHAHLVHHRHLWDEHLDPKRRRYEALGLQGERMDERRFLMRHVVGAVLLRHVPGNVSVAVGDRSRSRAEARALVTFWAVVLAIAFASGLFGELVVLWFVPYLTVFQVVRHWSETAEHAGLRTDDPWMSTRNWTATPVFRWLVAPHADSYHLAHHIAPGVPHYRLKRLHRELMRVPEYAAGHHCDGFVLPRRPDAPSVVRDICNPESIRVFRTSATTPREESLLEDPRVAMKSP